MATEKTPADLAVTQLKLRKLAQFHELSDGDFNIVLHHVRLIPVSAGDVLFEQGDRGDTMLFVAEGRLRVELVDAKGLAKDLGAVVEGQVVGEMAALDPAPRAARVVAASDGTVFELSVHSLREMRRTAPAVAASLTSSIIADVTQRLRSINERIDQELEPGKVKAPRQAGVATGARVSGGHVPRRAGDEDKAQEGTGFSRLWARLFG